MKMKTRRLKDSVVKEFAAFISDVITTERDPTDVTGARRRLSERTAPSGLGEQVPADGDFLVQPQFVNQIVTRSYRESAIMSRMTQWDVSEENANGLVIPSIDESSRVDGSRWGGLRGYWANEGDAATSTKMKFSNIELQPKKIIILAYLTDELMRDMNSLARYLLLFMGKELAFKVTDAAIVGDGAGKPQGVINSPAKIKVNAEGGQATATVVSLNVVNMLKRLWVGCHEMGTVAWFCHSDVLNQLPLLYYVGGTSPTMLYNTTTRLMCGFPVIPIEQCLPLGTEGDLILADFAEYMIGWRNRGEINTSMHVKFLSDENAIRLTARVDGQGSWNGAVTPQNGTNTQSPFITLATRP